MVLGPLDAPNCTVGVHEGGAIPGHRIAGTHGSPHGGDGLRAEGTLEKHQGSGEGTSDHRQPGEHSHSAELPHQQVPAQPAGHGAVVPAGHAPIRARPLRDQNEEADALTNEDFEGFSADNRIEVDVEKLPFIVLGRLLDRAMELDGSIKLARSSKEAKEDQERSKKKQRSNMRWEQPW